MTLKRFYMLVLFTPIAYIGFKYLKFKYLQHKSLELDLKILKIKNKKLKDEVAKSEEVLKKLKDKNLDIQQRVSILKKRKNDENI